MRLELRIWTAVTAVIGLIVAVFSILAILQHDAVLSQLIRQRLAVTVEMTARPFRSVVDLGLPVAMMRNKTDLLERARQSDPDIAKVVLFNPTGIVVAQVGDGRFEKIPTAIMAHGNDHAAARWGLETERDLISAVWITDGAENVVGGLLAVYPKSGLRKRAAEVAREVGAAAGVLFFLAAAFGFVAIRARLGRFNAALERMEEWLGKKAKKDAPDPLEQRQVRPAGGGSDAALETELAELGQVFERATARYEEIVGHLGAVEDGKVASPPAGPRATVLLGVPETPATRRFARSLFPVVAVLAFVTALFLGYFAFVGIRSSFQSEIVLRTQLIGTIATTDIERSLAAGVPAENLVGGDDYLTHVLEDFPELSYFAVVTDHPLLEVGVSGRNTSAQTRFPVEVGGEAVAYIMAETNLDYIAGQFRSVLIDLAVILLVVVLFTSELIVVVMTRSIAGPMHRVHHLAQLQAEGDFTKRLRTTGQNILARLGAILSERAGQVAAVAARGELPVTLSTLRIPRHPPDLLRFCSLTDVRLPLFLFAMADELPLSFFALYTRALDNSLNWLGEGVAIGLPMVAYLATALVGAPLARPIGQRVGYRKLFVAAAVTTIVAKLGLFAAQTIPQVIALHAINGLAFAFAALACQDYVLDMLPRQERSRSIGLFRATLFSGVFAATALGGILADRLGQRPVFVVCAILALVSAVLILWILPAGRQAEAVEDEKPEERLSFNIFSPLRRPLFAAVVIGSVLPLAILDHVFITYLLALQMDSLGASVSVIARVMMCFFLALIVSGHVQGRLRGIVARPEFLMPVSALSAGGVLVVAGLMPSIASTLAASVAAGMALGFSGGPQIDTAMEAVEGPLAHLGSDRVLGSIRVVERGGAMLGLVVVGWLTDRAGYSASVLIIGVLTAAGAGIFVVLRALDGSRKSGGG